MADPPVTITPRNTLGVKLGNDGYSFGIGNRGLELFASTQFELSGTATHVDYGLLSLDQPGADLPTLRSGQGRLPQGRDIISSSFAGASLSRPLGSATTLLGYGGLNRDGQLVIGGRIEHALTDEQRISLDLHRQGQTTSASLFYAWNTGTANTALQKFTLGVTTQNGDLALSSNYSHEKKIDLQGLGYLRTQLSTAATLGPAGQFSAAASASIFKDIYTYHISGVVPVTFEAGLNHTVSTEQKPKTAVVWQLKVPI